MKAPNPSRVTTLKSKTNKIARKAKRRLSKRTRLYGINGRAPTGKNQLVPVGNQAPWTQGGPSLGGGTSSLTNKTRQVTRKKKTVQRKVKNKALRKRVPVMGNTGTMGMMGY